jgi:hypothetical protein
MDDVIKFVALMLIVFISGLYFYCTKVACSSETKKYYVYTVTLSIYVINLYYIITKYSYYNYDTLKIGALLVTVPIIMYIWLCQQKCYELFFPTFFIIFPCIIIIFNLYVWSFQ